MLDFMVRFFEMLVKVLTILASLMIRSTTQTPIY